MSTNSWGAPFPLDQGLDFNGFGPRAFILSTMDVVLLMNSVAIAADRLNIWTLSGLIPMVSKSEFRYSTLFLA